MTKELKIPDVGESIQEVQIGQWLKQKGDRVEQDENVVELETDKASMELAAPAAGTLSEILKQNGEFVSVGEAIAYIEETQEKDRPPSEKGKEEEPAKRKKPTATDAPSEATDSPSEPSAAGEQPAHRPKDADERNRQKDTAAAESASPPVTPSARRALREHHLTAEEVEPQGKRIRRRDVERFVAQREASEEAERGEGRREAAAGRPKSPDADGHTEAREREELVPMSLIRRRIAERLVTAQQKAALLTTFNELDMSNVLQLRKRCQERFRQRYDVKLGLMSFFVKAAVDALKQFPGINAELRGTNILYRNYYHIGVAIGTAKGLVVPVLRHAETMSFAEIEKAIGDFVKRAGQNKIEPDDLEGGTFTISNGGIYGSLLSTPIVNPPQSGVLGMHAIEERPVARDGQVVVRPMMYVALTYDHRIVDGAEAVTFLKRIKEAVEDPARMLIEI